MVAYMNIRRERSSINNSLTAFIQRINKIKNNNNLVEVGIMKESKYPNGERLQVAEVAFRQEYGTRNIPERSFIRSTFHQNDNFKDLSNRLAAGLMKGTIKTEQALGILGQTSVQEIQKTIRELRTPPNTKETIKRKGSSNPLIDTGLLINSITYKVKDA